MPTGGHPKSWETKCNSATVAIRSQILVGAHLLPASILSGIPITSQSSLVLGEFVQTSSFRSRSLITESPLAIKDGASGFSVGANGSPCTDAGTARTSTVPTTKSTSHIQSAGPYLSPSSVGLVPRATRSRFLRSCSRYLLLGHIQTVIGTEFQYKGKLGYIWLV